MKVAATKSTPRGPASKASRPNGLPTKSAPVKEPQEEPPAKGAKGKGTKEKRRPEDKFGDAVMKHGYTLIPNLLLQAQSRLEIGHAEFNVLMQLIQHWWEADKDPYPAKEKIAGRMGLSSRQVQRYVTSLENSGLVRRVERFTGKEAQSSNGYDLTPLVRALKKIEPEFRKVVEQRRIRERRVERGKA